MNWHFYNEMQNNFNWQPADPGSTVYASGCQKLLDKEPITQIVATGDSTQITTDAEFDPVRTRLTRGDFDWSLTCSIASSTATWLPTMPMRAETILPLLWTSSRQFAEWKYGSIERCLGIIGRINITIDQVQKCIDLTLQTVR
jgi:hypothetical protein